jgi:hypothetical protein
VHSAELFADLDAAPRDADGNVLVVADGTGERVALSPDAGRPVAPWTIPLPDISYRVERAAAKDVAG